MTELAGLNVAAVKRAEALAHFIRQDAEAWENFAQWLAEKGIAKGAQRARERAELARKVVEA